MMQIDPNYERKRKRRAAIRDFFFSDFGKIKVEGHRDFNLLKVVLTAVGIFVVMIYIAAFC